MYIGFKDFAGIEECHFQFLASSEIMRTVFSGCLRECGPTDSASREYLWEGLEAIRGIWDDPCCIGGDFNVIRFPDERNRGGEGRISKDMRRLG